VVDTGVTTSAESTTASNAPLGPASAAAAADASPTFADTFGASPVASLEPGVGGPFADGRAALVEHSEYDARIAKYFSPLLLVLGDQATRYQMIAEQVYAGRFSNGVTVFGFPTHSATLTVDETHTLVIAGFKRLTEKTTEIGMRCSCF
jgi:hypothetical protein